MSTNKVILARNAMATRFEFVLAGANPVSLRAAGEEALDEILRIEAQLSLYNSASEIAQVNARAFDEPVRVSPEVFGLLLKAKEFWQITEGAFDITIAPLVRCWGFMKGSGARPTDEEIAVARERVGMQLLELDEANSTVRFPIPGMMLDLGSIGKGYALDFAAEILRDSGVENALLHGGTSTIIGLGSDPEQGPWKVVIEKPPEHVQQAQVPQESVVAIVELHDMAVSVSAVWGKSFTLENKTYGHVIDPRTGWPSEKAVLGAAMLKSAAESDALSTAVLLDDESELGILGKRCPALAYLQLQSGGDGIKKLSRGLGCSLGD